MNISALFKTLAAVDSALLPSTTALWLTLHLGWAMVLVSMTHWLATRFVPRYQSALAWLVLLWSLLPGALSPAFWLGLALQSPSMMTVLLCLGWLLQQVRSTSAATAWQTAADARSLKLMAGMGVVLGWVLLLDTLAWFPVSIYAWGFAASAVALAALVSALYCWQQGSRASSLPFCVMTIFVLTRLPSGNVWDALLDPSLWLVLQVGWLVSVMRRRWQARHLPAATRV